MDVVEVRAEIEDMSKKASDRLDLAVREHLRVRFPDFYKNLEMRLYDLRIVPVGRSTLRGGRKMRRVVSLNAPPSDSAASTRDV